MTDTTPPSDTERDRMAETLHTAQCGCRGNLLSGPCPLLVNYWNQADALITDGFGDRAKANSDLRVLQEAVDAFAAERVALAAKVAAVETERDALAKRLCQCSRCTPPGGMHHNGPCLLAEYHSRRHAARMDSL